MAANYDELAVSNIVKSAEVFLAMMDNHGPVDLREASGRLEAEGKDFGVNQWRRNKYRELAAMVRRAAIS